MSKQIIRDVMVRVNGIDISPICRSVTLESEKTEEEVTGYSTAYKEHVAGIDETSIEIELLLGTDGAAVVTEPTLDPPVIPGGSAYWNGLLFDPWFVAQDTTIMDIAPHNAPSSSSNPWTTLTARLMTWKPLSGAVGDPMAGFMGLKATGAYVVGWGLFPSDSMFPSESLYPAG